MAQRSSMRVALRISELESSPNQDNAMNGDAETQIITRSPIECYNVNETKKRRAPADAFFAPSRELDGLRRRTELSFAQDWVADDDEGVKPRRKRPRKEEVPASVQMDEDLFEKWFAVGGRKDSAVDAEKETYGETEKGCSLATGTTTLYDGLAVSDEQTVETTDSTRLVAGGQDGSFSSGSSLTSLSDDDLEDEYEGASDDDGDEIHVKPRRLHSSPAFPCAAKGTKTSRTLKVKSTAQPRNQKKASDRLSKKVTPKGSSLYGVFASRPRSELVKANTPRLALAASIAPTTSAHAASATSTALASTTEPINDDLLRLSRRLTHREPPSSKPLPLGQPRIWAASRQALCETLPYFKKPQGGCHTNDRHVYGFLFDGAAHCREYMDADVIIARAAGGMEPDDEGTMVQRKHQSHTDAQTQAFENDMELQNPIVVIVGDRNAGSLTRVPRKYCVLGWYKPVAVWAEKTMGKGTKAWNTVKYRMERLGAEKGPAWHAPRESMVSEEDPRVAGVLEERACKGCGKVVPRIYLEGWTCLNEDCDLFWKYEDGCDFPCGALDFNPAFLLERYPWDTEIEPYDVRPPLPSVGQTVGDHLTYIHTRGACCPKCGRCNSRYLWNGWRCDNPECDWSQMVSHPPVLPAALHTPWDWYGQGPALARNKHAPGVKVKIQHLHGYKVHTYTFEGIEGTFVHACANERINREPGGPNDMLIELQTKDMGLERRIFGSSGRSSKREMWHSKPLTVQQLAGLAAVENEYSAVVPGCGDGDFMTAFSMNYGMPYQFVATGASRSFEDAPEAVRACRSRLNWAAKTFLNVTDEEVDFNEELIFAYMEGQKIDYHDDGEEGLGPRIATLSLGGKARMHLRMKTKHFVGCTKSGLLVQECPKPHSVGGRETYEKRLEAWQEVQTIKDADPLLYRKRLSQLPRELGIFEKRCKKAEDLVTVTLSHGDVVLMEGYEIQQYLEHRVVPEGYLRFGMTCRDVLPSHLSKEEMPSYSVLPDRYGYDGSKPQEW